MHGFTLIELMIVIAIIAIIAAIAVPNLMESRITANEAAAAASLRSGVLPAEIQFQGGTYQDADLDNAGEYGTLGALAGLVPSHIVTMPGGSLVTGLHLLQGPLAIGENWDGVTTAGIAAPALGRASGYFFAAYAAAGSDDTTDAGTGIWFEGAQSPLPNGMAIPAGHAAGYASQGALKALPVPTGGVNLAATSTANAGERCFIAVCAPQRYGSTGRRPFVLGADGLIRSPSRGEAVGAFFQGTPAGGWSAQVPSGAICTAATLARGVTVALDPAYATGGVVVPSLPTVAMYDDLPAATPARVGGTVYFQPYQR